MTVRKARLAKSRPARCGFDFHSTVPTAKILMKPRDTIIFQLFYGESDKKFGYPNVNKLTLSPQGYGATNVHHFVYVRDFIMFTEVKCPRGNIEERSPRLSFQNR